MWIFYYSDIKGDNQNSDIFVDQYEGPVNSAIERHF